MVQHQQPRVSFLGVPLVAVDTSSFIMGMMELARRNAGPAMVTYLNAWCSNIAAKDPQYARLLQSAEAVYADGQAIVWAARHLHTPIPERVNAGDFILEFCREAQRHGLSLYLLGSEDGVAAAAAQRFQLEVPGLNIVGAEAGFFPGGEEAVLERVRQAAPDFLLVGMGVPRQEQWAAEHLPQLNARVVWCVGALFEYYGQARARAPRWMIRAGLEWLFRLVLEPRRLWKRYLVGNVVFVWRVLRAKARSGR